uniref:Uncharacterized protein n=1 Tax=Arundo donax TaxID=35708 RepID=A0A0A9FV74_ARUDO
MTTDAAIAQIDPSNWWLSKLAQITSAVYSKRKKKIVQENVPRRM